MLHSCPDLHRTHYTTPIASFKILKINIFLK